MLKLLTLLFSGAKFGKVLTSAGSMLVSLVLYAFVFGWRYAAGFIALLFVHEMGHYVAARLKGLPVGLPTFIPFIGAWVELKKLPHDAATEAYIGMGGPLLGTLGALLCFAVARGNPESAWLLAVAYSGFILNLFNLIPLPPFDGGRITSVLSPRIWLLGGPLLVAVFWWNPSPMLLIVALLAAPQAWQAWKHRRSPEAATYYAVSPALRWRWGAAYLILVAFLAIMSHDTHALLRPHR
ncbi:site-2 protease family protein [Inhella gelatinilytica]|uniref:Site-2 protease family protein n=1 Tax=Inhella gelatinilytica TaxID=2795030 RepID=A0A931IYZ6_9BURK|nr:site-2 protease family protein [Inhella gelatinilytica]MBH9553590.1 site-2 protease family protein [Inhella gelatinilytica]